MAEIIDSMALGAAPTGRPIAEPPAAPAAPTDRPARGSVGPTGPANRTPQPNSPATAPSNRAPQPSTARAAPTNRTQQAQPAPDAPRSIAVAYVDPDVPPFALNHARILYASALAGSSVSATGGTGAPNVLNPATYSRWAFTGTQTVTITLPVARSIDAVGLGAHSLASGSALVEYSTSDGGAWVQFAPAQSGGAAMLFLSDVAVNAKRLRVTVTAAGAQVLGVIYAGVALQMQRPIYRGVAPPTLSRVTEYQSNESEGGQWLGRNVIRQGLKIDLSWSRLSAAWVRAYFDPFAVSAQSSPFFVAWNPQEFPREVAYAWTSSDLTPSNTGPRDLMSVTILGKGAA